MRPLGNGSTSNVAEQIEDIQPHLKARIRERMKFAEVFHGKD